MNNKSNKASAKIAYDSDLDSEADPNYVEKKLKEIQDKINKVSDEEEEKANPFLEANFNKPAKKKTKKNPNQNQINEPETNKKGDIDETKKSKKKKSGNLLKNDIILPEIDQENDFKLSKLIEDEKKNGINLVEDEINDKPTVMKEFNKTNKNKQEDDTDYWKAKPKNIKKVINLDHNNYDEDELKEDADSESMGDNSDKYDEDDKYQKRKKSRKVVHNNNDEEIDEFMTQGGAIEEMLEKKTKQLGKFKSKLYVAKAEGLGNHWLLFVILILFSTIFYLKLKEELYQKKVRFGADQGELEDDYYEALEVDSSASLEEIKRQYKKLVLAWHPDKNPECGIICNEKFAQIHRAYEVLSDPNMRKAYDENQGIITPIKSDTVALTTHNYKRLVEDSPDLWIIQIFEDGNPACAHFSGIWESAAQEYGSIIKFGRINVSTQRELLKYLPIKVQIYPTVISMARGYEHNIFTIYYHNKLIELRKFIEKSVESYIDYLDYDNFKSLYDSWKKSQTREKEDFDKPVLIYLTNKDKAPLAYKYNSMLFHTYIDFKQNLFGELNKMTKLTQKPELDFLVSFDIYNPETELFTKQLFEFEYKEKTLNDNHFKKVMDFIKFNLIPDIHKETLKSFCGNDELKIDRSTVYGYQEDIEGQEILPDLCVLVLKNSTRMNLFKKSIQEVKAFQSSHLNVIYNDAKTTKSRHEASEIQAKLKFGVVDLDFHKRLGRFLNMVFNIEGMRNVHAIALQLTNNKYYVCEKIETMEDWLESLTLSLDQMDAYYLNQHLKNNMLEDYLQFENDTAIKMIWQQFSSNLFDISLIMTFILIIIMNKFVFKISWQKNMLYGTLLYIIANLSLSLYHKSEDIF